MLYFFFFFKFTVEAFKLTCTTTKVKRGMDVPLLSERVLRRVSVSGETKVLF